MTKQVFANSQVAHVWAQGGQAYGRSHNGNFYFDGRVLYSYGSHFAVGVRMNDNQAVLNSDTYSVSTSGMQSDARSAVNHFETVHVPELQSISHSLSYIANNGTKHADGAVSDVIRHVEKHAAKLNSKRRGRELTPGGWDTPDGSWQPNADYRSPTYEETTETDAEALLRFCGIPAARAKAAIKRGLAKAEKAAKAEAAARLKADKAEAAELADMTPLAFDAWADQRRIGFAATHLFRLQKVAKAAGMSAKRQASLKSRRAALRARIAAYEANREAADKAERAERFAVWRAAYDAAKTDADKLAVWSNTRLRPVDYEGEQAQALQAARDEAVEINARQRMEAEREAREAWLKGEGSRHVRLSGPNGTALVRRSPDGERLETSHGADVPWDHAVKAFRFIALCVERGEGFKTNGRVVRVGHFRVDEITPEGDMRAGCHTFAWGVMKALAEREGVLTLAPSDEAVETREGVAH